MACVSINISHRRWDDPRNAYLYFSSSHVDGRYAEGSQAWGWGGYPKLTDAEYLEQVAIPRTLSYLGGNFQKVYGRPMKRTDICGQEGYLTDAEKAAVEAARVEAARVEAARIEAERIEAAIVEAARVEAARIAAAEAAAAEAARVAAEEAAAERTIVDAAAAALLELLDGILPKENSEEEAAAGKPPVTYTYILIAIILIAAFYLLAKR